jgi:lysophospholipase L1-like esterase
MSRSVVAVERPWHAAFVVSVLSLGALLPPTAHGQGPIVALGDSITRGVRPGVKAEETFAALLESGLRKQKIEADVVNAGIGGERTDQALARLDKAILARKPGVVLVMYGTNDSYVDAGQKEPRLSVEQYAANLKAMVEAIHKAGAVAVLMTPPQWAEGAKNGAGENPNKRLAPYAEACRAVARETQSPLVDHFATWRKAALRGTDLGGWTTDMCHPNPRGHREIAEQILPVVQEVLKKGGEKPWKAGIARAVITPSEAVWLSGYAGKRVPTGKLHDLWVKVLALEDADGRRAVLLTSDLIGFSKAAYDDLCAELKKRHGLDRDQLLLTFSHTHSGPVLRESLIDYFPLDDDARRLIADYSRSLEATIVTTVGKALADLAPAQLETGEGQADFAVNRRNNKEAEVAKLLAKGEKLKGPVDHSVPLLVVRTPAGKLRALVFGYACHNTTLNGTLWCGDYSGFAQAAVEKQHPEAVAMFWAGCGADQNPLPRRQVELCERYGKMLADGVEQALKKPLDRLPAALRTSYASIDLKYEKIVPRATLEQAAKEPGVRGRWAQRLLARIDAKEPLAIATSYDYPVVVWHLGGRQLWIAVAGEVVIDYALRFKTEYGQHTWVAAYVNDLVAYIPSRRVWDEGGYEGAGVYEYGLPAERWASDTEERIAARVRELVRQVGAGKK